MKPVTPRVMRQRIRQMLNAKHGAIRLQAIADGFNDEPEAQCTLAREGLSELHDELVPTLRQLEPRDAHLVHEAFNAAYASIDALGELLEAIADEATELVEEQHEIEQRREALD